MSNTTDTKFEWTDELVKEYGEWYAKTQGNPPAPLWGKDLFDHWKASKLPKEERIEVTELGAMGGGRYGIGQIFYATSPIPKEKYPQVKQAIESVLNNDTEVEDKAHSVLINDDIYFHNNGRSYNEWFYEFRIKKEIEHGKWNALSKLIVDFINAPLGEIITIEQYRAKKYTQSEVDTIRREEGLYWFREGYKYSRSFTSKIPYDEIDELTVVNAFKEISSLNSKEEKTSQSTLSRHKSEWEITAYSKKTMYGFDAISTRLPNGNFCSDFRLGTNVEITEKYLKDNSHSIHTVKRLSDGVVFSVGDRVTYENVPAHSWENRNGCLISYFKVSGEDIYINSHDAGETLHDISEWIKLSPEPSPIQEDKLKEYFKPYDTRKTVDNTDTDLPSTVKDKDIIWFVNQYWELHSKVKDTHHPADNDKNITVKDKEAGEQYILENKPCLSLKEIWSITAEYGLPFVEFEKQIGEYTQQKLKQ